MRPTAPVHEVRTMKFLDALERFQSKRLTSDEAAKLLDVSRTTFYRMRQKYEENGLDGLVDRRVGKISAKRIPVDIQMAICDIYKSRYAGWTVKHFHEKLSQHGHYYSYTSVKNILQKNGCVQKAVEAHVKMIHLEAK